MSITMPDNHQHCRVCKNAFFADTPLRFEALGEAQIRAKIIPTDKVQGYDRIMQGGLISALHDSAMLHCLYHLGIANAMTVSLSTRYHHPVYIGRALEVNAQWIRSKRGIHFLESRVTQQENLCSSAVSQFMS